MMCKFHPTNSHSNNKMAKLSPVAGEISALYMEPACRELSSM